MKKLSTILLMTALATSAHAQLPAPVVQKIARKSHEIGKVLKNTNGHWDEVIDAAGVLAKEENVVNHAGFRKLLRKTRRVFHSKLLKLQETVSNHQDWSKSKRRSAVLKELKPAESYQSMLRSAREVEESSAAFKILSSFEKKPSALRDSQVVALANSLDNPGIKVITANDQTSIAATLEDLVSYTTTAANNGMAQRVLMKVDILALESDPNFKYVGGGARAVKSVIEAAKSDPNIVFVFENIDMMIGSGDSITGSANMLGKLIQSLEKNQVTSVFTINNKKFDQVKSMLPSKHLRVDLGVLELSDKKILDHYLEFTKGSETDIYGLSTAAKAALIDLANNYYKVDAKPFRFRNAFDDALEVHKQKLIHRCEGICDQELSELFALLHRKRFLADESTKRSLDLVAEIKEVENKLDGILKKIQDLDIQINLNVNRSQIELTQKEVGNALLSAKKLPDVLTKSVGEIAAFVDAKLELLDLQGQEKVRQALRVSLIDGFVKLKHGITDGPLAVLDFTGASGAGKTYLTTQMNRLFFGGSDSVQDLVRINIGQARNVESSMAEIVEKIHSNPKALVVFDEADKNPEFLRGMMDLLDESVTCVADKCVDFSQKPIVVISNFGANNKDAQTISAVGTGAHTDYLNDLYFWAKEYFQADDLEQINAALDEFAKLSEAWSEQVTLPVKELNLDASTIGRMQSFPFRELGPDARKAILIKQFEDVVATYKRMEGQELGPVSIEISDHALKALTLFSYSQNAGRTVRAFKRMIIPMIRVALTDELARLGSNLEDVHRIQIGLASDGLEFKSILNAIEVKTW